MAQLTKSGALSDEKIKTPKNLPRSIKFSKCDRIIGRQLAYLTRGLRIFKQIKNSQKSTNTLKIDKNVKKRQFKKNDKIIFLDLFFVKYMFKNVKKHLKFVKND